MRFPRLSNLFHRRSRSDGALDDMRREPMATLPPRPVSANGIDELVLSSAHPHEPSTLFASDAGVPVLFTHPLPPVATSLHAVDQQPAAIFPALEQRIRELESALCHQYRANRRIPALERALTDCRAALESAHTASTNATSEASSLRARLIQTQRVLHTALTTPPSADDRARVLAAENTAIASERLRYHRFIELLISAGAHKPVLSRAYNDVSAGVDPEEALIAAIREALEQPDSPWTALLEPIIGARTPEEYKAQVRATLDARKDAKRWRKKAKWWKSRAIESGMKAVLTPSPSDISSIVEELSEQRQHALGELRERRQGGKSGLPQTERSQASQQTRKNSFFPVRHSSLPSHSELATLASALLPSLTSEELAISGISAAAAPEVAPTLIMPTSTSVEYPRLAPLASQVFRASMSHNSSLHTPSRRSSVSYTPSLSASFSFPHSKKGTKKAGISASSSTSSARSRRRRVEVVAVPSPSASGSMHLAVPTTGAGPSTASSLAKLGHIHEESEPEPTPPMLASSCPIPTPRSAFEPPSYDVNPTQLTDESMVLVSSAHEPPITLEQDIDDELVIVMHTDATHTLRNTPILSSMPFTPTRPQRDLKGRATPSPEGKSRLPVLKKAIRRLSISKPVLVDTTNAATFTFARAKSSSKPVDAVKGVPLTFGKSSKSAMKSDSTSSTQRSRLPTSGGSKTRGGTLKSRGLVMRDRKGTV